MADAGYVVEKQVSVNEDEDKTILLEATERVVGSAYARIAGWAVSSFFPARLRLVATLGWSTQRVTLPRESLNHNEYTKSVVNFNFISRFSARMKPAPVLEQVLAFP